MGILKSVTGLSRRKFIGVSALAIGFFTALKNIQLFTPKRKTAKFLTRDGRLVEVDLSKLPKHKKAINKQQLASWIWKDQTL